MLSLDRVPTNGTVPSRSPALPWFGTDLKMCSSSQTLVNDSPDEKTWAVIEIDLLTPRDERQLEPGARDEYLKLKTLVIDVLPALRELGCRVEVHEDDWDGTNDDEYVDCLDSFIDDDDMEEDEGSDGDFVDYSDDDETDDEMNGFEDEAEDEDEDGDGAQDEDR